MTKHDFTESDVESAALARLKAIGWPIAHGPDIAPGGVIFTQTFHQKVRVGDLRP